MDYQKIYDNLVKKRIENPPTEKFERHHIVPRSLGGSDDKDNIVKLTYREHFMAHLLLCRIHRGTRNYFPMLRALNMMKVGRGDSHIKNSRVFEYFRADFAKAMSDLQQGENNSQYGTAWYYHPELKINKRFKSDDAIPAGFVKGRKVEKHLKDGRVLGGFDYINHSERLKIKEERVCEMCGGIAIRRKTSKSSRCDECVAKYIGSKTRIHDYEALFEEWKASNMPVIAFAKTKGLANSTLYVGWNKRGINWRDFIK